MARRPKGKERERERSDRGRDRRQDDGRDRRRDDDRERRRDDGRDRDRSSSRCDSANFKGQLSLQRLNCGGCISDFLSNLPGRITLDRRWAGSIIRVPVVNTADRVVHVSFCSVQRSA